MEIPTTAAPIESRTVRQSRVFDWCIAAFGIGQTLSLPQRGIRLLEEAIEAAQAAGCDQAMAHKLVDYVFSRPVGDIRQEIGGVSITLLALASAAKVRADDAEVAELERVLAKPLDQFKARNRAKNEAGFFAATPPAPAPAEGDACPAPALPLAPIMSQGDGAFEWWWQTGTREPETYGSSCATRAQAIDAARANGGEQDGFWIVEADHAVPLANAAFDGERVLEDYEEGNEHCWGEDGPDIGCAEEEDLRELEQMLGETLQRWMDSHGIAANVWAFGEQRNKEFFPAAEHSPAHASDEGRDEGACVSDPALP